MLLWVVYLRGWQDGWEDKGARHEARGPEFSPWNPRCRRRDLEFPKLSSDFHKSMDPVCAHTCLHTYTQIINGLKHLNKIGISKENEFTSGMISYSVRSLSSKRWLHLVTVLFTLPRWINLTVLLSRDQTDAPYSGFRVFKGSQYNSVRPCRIQENSIQEDSHRLFSS